MDTAIVSTIIKGLEQSRKSMNAMQTQIQTIELRLAVMETEQKIISSDVTQLLRIIRDGNGQEPIMDRVSDLENDQKNIQEFIKAYNENYKEEKRQKKEIKNESAQVKIALITSVFSFLAMVIVGGFTYFKK
jgi:chromosome segregation ATPase